MPSADRALGTLGKLLVGSVVLLVSVVVALGVLALLQSLIGAVISLLVTGATLAVVGYAIYWIGTTLLGSDDAETTERDLGTFDEPTDSVDRLTEQYKRGEITEAELERQLERELDDSGTTELERELE